MHGLHERLVEREARMTILSPGKQLDQLAQDVALNTSEKVLAGHDVQTRSVEMVAFSVTYCPG